VNRRFEMYQYRHILVRMRLGESDRQIDAAGLMGRRAASKLRKKAQRAGWLEPEHPLPSEQDLLEALQRPKSARARAQSTLEPYRKTIEKWVGDGIRGTTIHQALKRKYAYAGSYSSVRRFIRGLSDANPQVTTVLEFAPGEAAQVDFGKGPEIVDVYTGEVFKTWFFVMTLAWSRHQYAELVRDQSVETWMGCHRRSFDAITRACYHDPQVQRSYAESAEGYGFLISPCPVADPKKKGRVESGVKYVKNNFAPLRDFRDLVDANRQLMAWVMGEAGNRCHGTTREAPLKRFVETEQHLLRPLPDTHELVAVHTRASRPGERMTIDAHLPPEYIAYKMRDPQWCLKQAKAIGPHCHALITRLFADRVLDRLRAAQGVVRLGERYGATRLEAACGRALYFENIQYRSVRIILEKGLDRSTDPETCFDALSDSYTGNGRFGRNTRDLFN